MNKQLKNVPAGNKGLKKLPTAVRNKMGFMAKGGAVMKAKGGAVMAKGGSVKMAKGGMASKGYAIGGAIDEIKKKKTAKGMAKGGAVSKPKRERAKDAEPMKGMKGMKMAGGGMAKGYKAGGVATKGGTKGGVTGGKMARKRDGIAKRGKTRA
tara:strand:- start:66 stop:524 length:459 start_codon:yes stop_codon:yes gene_type:complete